MIKIVAFDFVGVLAREKHVELGEVENKLERMFGDNLNDEDYLNEAKKITSADVIDITYGIFDKLYNPVSKTIFTELKSKYSNIRFIIATNHVSYIRKYINKTFNDVDDIIISAEIEKIKPNRNFYEYILQKYNIKPEELLFLDDNENNVKGAAILGINAIKINKDTDIFQVIKENQKILTDK